MKFGSIRAVGQVVATGSISSNTTTLLTGSGQLTNLGYATTGSNVFTGTQTMSGSIIPAVTNTYDLGTPTQQFRHVYISSGSLYINGTKVLGSTSQELQITTDVGQSFKILESGSDTITLQSADGNVTLTSSGGGDVILDPNTGVIALKGTITVYTGNKIVSSDGNSIQFGNGIAITGSIVSTVTPLVSGSAQIVGYGFATTGSNTFQGTQTVNGSLVITGSITAQQYIVSSSVTYLTESFASGSHKFGDSLDDNHTFTGSLLLTGSYTQVGNIYSTGSVNAYANGGAAVFGSSPVTAQTNVAQFANGNPGITSYTTLTSAGTGSAVPTWTTGNSQIIEFVPSGGNGIIDSYTGNLILQTGRVNAVTINSSQQTTFAAKISVANETIVGSQGGSDTTYIAGGSGYGSIIRSYYANGSINNEIRGNGDNYFNVVQGGLAIGTTTSSNKLSVRANADFGATGYAYVGPTQYGGLMFPRGQILFSNTNSQNQFYLSSNAYTSAAGVFAYRNSSQPALALGLDNGAMTFLTAGNGTADATVSWTTAMTINNGGQVQRPNQPAFLAYNSAGFTVTAGSWYNISNAMTTEAYDVSSNYGTSTAGRFIAPVSGRYLFYFGGWSSISSNGERYAVCATINGGGYNYIGGGNYCITDSPLNNYTVVHNLSAGDYVDLMAFSAVGGTWGSNPHYVYWGGYLL